MARKKKTESERTLDRLYKIKGVAEEAMGRLLPKAILAMETKLETGAKLGKEDIMFLRFLQSLTLHNDRLKEDLGLNPKALTAGGQHPLLAVFAGGNVDIRAFKAMSEEERERLLLDAAGGKQLSVPVIEAEVVEDE